MGIQEYSVWTLTSGILATNPKSALYMSGYANAGTVSCPINYQLITGAGRTILFDIGWEDPEALRANNTVDWEPIVEQLGRLGVKPADVDTVVLSHLHFDHAGQSQYFPKATFYVQKSEMDYVDWAFSYPLDGPKGFLTTAYSRPDVDALRDYARQGRLALVDGYHDLGPGLKIAPALDTHTPGSQMLVVNTSRGALVLTGDAVYTRGNITEWKPLGFQQGSTIQEIKVFERVLNLVGGNMELVVTPHDPDTFSLWPSWKSGRSMVAEIALAPRQKSVRAS